MNCIDFRRRILADPRQPGEGELRHAHDCAACHDFHERQRELDAELFAALQVAPPDGLAERIIIARGMRKRRWIFPLAAGLLLSGGLAALWPRLAPDPLGREAIAHVALEPQSFTSSKAEPGDFLPAVLSDQGISLARAVGEVTYSQLCPMAGRVARHLVVRTAQGPVTLFLMPDDSRSRRRAVVEHDGMAALTLPASKGTIAIVANRLEDVLAMEKSLRAS